ncbi:lamin tail domain-containing protein [Candidatus Bipolaricaulota bacterium]|nr:lamin tail domain-containing protein [Candidatus Bipolaricaulota bacterium]
MKTGGSGLLLGFVLLLGASCFGQGIVINEVAWSGTAASSADEWIELYNAGPVAIDLAGWSIQFGETVIQLGFEQGATREVRSLSLEPGQFLLLERTDDRAVDSRVADVIYVGSLSNAGCAIQLVDADGNVVDTANRDGENWPAGTSSDGVPPFASMERIDPLVSDVASNWRTASVEWGVGVDANGELICGTPGEENGATVRARHTPQVGVLRCDPESGRTIAVEWTAADPDGTAAALIVDLEGSTDDGTTWVSIVSGLANSGAYIGPLPASLAISNDADVHLLVRVTATDADGWKGSGVVIVAPGR